MARTRETRQETERLIRDQAGIESIVGALLDATAAPGECRIDDDGLHDTGDYPDIRPVMTKQGLRWCCTFGHCSDVIVPLDQTRITL